MSGHSKWKQIKHKKGALDLKKGAMFTRHARLIEIAAKRGGGDPNMNPNLKQAIEKAKSDCNIPNLNVERAIKKGTGELKDGNEISEVMYEGFAPEGVALYIHTVTDNKNRTVNAVRLLIEKHGGRMGSAGSIGYMFKQVGLITVKISGNVEELELKAIDAGASDVKDEGDTLEIYTEPNQLAHVKKGLEASGIKIESAELTFIPTNSVRITEHEKARKVLNIIELLEENEDVMNVFANFDIDSEILEKL